VLVHSFVGYRRIFSHFIEKGAKVAFLDSINRRVVFNSNLEYFGGSGYQPKNSFYPGYLARIVHISTGISGALVF
jgi:hypothetical protein